MTFRSLDFVTFCLAVITTFYLLPLRLRKVFLLGVSLFFIGYASLQHLALFLAVRAVDFWVVQYMSRQLPGRKRGFLCLSSLILNLGTLFLFKYLSFFLNIFGTGNSRWDLLLPLGISFYTFHSLSYMLDVFNGTITSSVGFLDYLTYVSFFPHFVAGPIARANKLLPQMQFIERLVPENLISGAYLISKGFLMKVVLADALGNEVDSHFTGEYSQSPLLLLQTVYFYSFQVYFDFSGYSNIAIGLARCLGCNLQKNFDLPYFADSMTEFWKRWHISLTEWLRDYVFYPLVLSLRAVSYWSIPLALFLVFVLSGLWHGANGTYVVWGCLHGMYLVVEKAMSPTLIGKFFRERVPRFGRQLLVFHFVTLASVFFRAPSIGGAFAILGRIFSNMKHLLEPGFTAGWKPVIWAMLVTFMAFEWLENKYLISKRFASLHWMIQSIYLYLVTLLTLLFAAPNPQTFVYLRF